MPWHLVATTIAGCPAEQGRPRSQACACSQRCSQAKYNMCKLAPAHACARHMCTALKSVLHLPWQSCTVLHVPFVFSIVASDPIWQENKLAAFVCACARAGTSHTLLHCPNLQWSLQHLPNIF